METKLAERRARMKRFAKIATVAAVISLPCASSFCVHPLGIAVEGGRTRASRALPLRSLRATAVKVRTGGSGDDDSSDATQRPWPPKERRVKEYSLMEGEVAVRFINSPGRYPSDGTNDIIAAAKPGEVLLKVGDSVGVELPRGCLTGLCGSCTCDIEEPLAGAENGFRAIARACSTTVAVPEGCEEMVVDVYRMINNKGKSKEDPMARFNKLDDPNEGFKARWNLPQGTKTDCTVCGATGVDPKGMMPEDCLLSPGCPFNKKTREA